MISTPKPSTLGSTASPRFIGRVTRARLISRMTSKILSLGISAEVRTLMTGTSGKTVRTVVQRVRVGQVISAVANCSPRLQALPVTVKRPSRSSMRRVQPLSLIHI